MDPGGTPLTAEKLARIDVPGLFRSHSNGQPAMDETTAVSFLGTIQKQLGLNPPKSDVELKNVFQSVQRSGVMTHESFMPMYQSWVQKAMKSPETGDLLQPSPISAFYSHPINKSYEVRVPMDDTRYVKISFANPDERPKQLKPLSEDSSILVVRNPELTLQPRIGQDYIRLKFVGRKQPSTADIRLALLHNETEEVEEVLLFHVVTEARAASTAVLEPIRLQIPVNRDTASE